MSPRNSVRRRRALINLVIISNDPVPVRLATDSITTVLSAPAMTLPIKMLLTPTTLVRKCPNCLQPVHLALKLLTVTWKLNPRSRLTPHTSSLVPENVRLLATLRTIVRGETRQCPNR